MPRENNATINARVRADHWEVRASDRTAIKEMRAETHPMREREKISAVKMTLARKSQNTTGSSSTEDKTPRSGTSLRTAARRRVCALRNARTTTKGRTIPNKPAK